MHKRPPTKPNAARHEDVNEEEQVDPLAEAHNQAQNVPPQEPIQPQIHGDAIPETSQARACGSAHEAEGAGVSSLAAHLGSLENFSFTPLFFDSPSLPVSHI